MFLIAKCLIVHLVYIYSKVHVFYALKTTIVLKVLSNLHHAKTAITYFSVNVITQAYLMTLLPVPATLGYIWLILTPTISSAEHALFTPHL
jgi:hypothetical protein